MRKISKLSVIIGVFVLSLLSSCTKNEELRPKIENEENSVETLQIEWEIKNKQHQQLIETLGDLYEISIKEVLATNLKSISLNISQQIEEAYQSKINELIASQANLKSANTEDVSYILSDEYYIPFAEELLMRLNAVIDDTLNISTKEDFIMGTDKIFNEYNNEIMNSASISEIEKQCIIENNVLRYNKFILTVEYLEQIDGTTYQKGSFKDWLKKNAAILRCTALTLTASAACATAVATTVVATGTAVFTIGTVVVPAAYATYVTWATCVAATINATVCWALID